MMELADFYNIWNDLHCKTVKIDVENRNEIMANWLESHIITAKKAYYETGNPIMDDPTYDKIESYLKILRPNSKMLEKVGS